MSDRSQYVAGIAQGYLAEVLAMALIEKGIVDCETICAELESLASIRRAEDAGAIATELAKLAVSLRAARRV